MRLAIPSDGELYEATLGFLRRSGLPVERSSPRRYTAAIHAIPDTTVLFQRASDIPVKVEEGSADLGISERTVKNHLTATMAKLRASDRTHAVVTAARLGWLRL